MKQYPLGRLGKDIRHLADKHERGIRSQRKIGNADLQLIILILLEEKPRHGYEIIKALEEHSRGFYSPSPGMVYPILTYLEELGYTKIEIQGPKKLYHLTEIGLEQLNTNRENTVFMLAKLALMGQKMEHFQKIADTEMGIESTEPAALELAKARHELKMALMEKMNATAAEQQRLSQILQQATQQIRLIKGDK